MFRNVPECSMFLVLSTTVTLAPFQSSENTPWIADWLKISQIGLQMRSAHSRISLADIISRPVAFDLSSLFKSEKNFICRCWTEIKLFISTSEVVQKTQYICVCVLVRDTPFNFRDVTDFFQNRQCIHWNYQGSSSAWQIWFGYSSSVVFEITSRSFDLMAFILRTFRSIMHLFL